MEKIVALLFCMVLAEWRYGESAPIPTRMVDLTHPFDNTTINWPGMPRFQMNVSFLNMPNVNARIQIEEFTSATHVGTHMDAPCHFVPGRQTMADVPLERLIAPAAVVDVQEKVAEDSDYEVQIDDLRRWENATGQRLDGVILLVRSGWSKKWNNRTAFIGNPNNDTNNLHFPGVSPSASRWLADKRNVYGVGVEPLSLDHGPSRDFRTHLNLGEKNIFGLENVDSMEELPIYGATLYVMPMKLGGGACGALARIVATFPRVVYGLPKAKPRQSGNETFHEVIRFA